MFVWYTDALLVTHRRMNLLLSHLSFWEGANGRSIWLLYLSGKRHLAHEALSWWARQVALKLLGGDVFRGWEQILRDMAEGVALFDVKVVESDAEVFHPVGDRD
jgi:hypothetical protein